MKRFNAASFLKQRCSDAETNCDGPKFAKKKCDAKVLSQEGILQLFIKGLIPGLNVSGDAIPHPCNAFFLLSSAVNTSLVAPQTVTVVYRGVGKPLVSQQPCLEVSKLTHPGKKKEKDVQISLNCGQEKCPKTQTSSSMGVLFLCHVHVLLDL